MFAVDVDKLLQPVSEDAPCGENREYDASFIQMEQAAQPKPGQQFGDTIVPGEDPDWRRVKQLATELLDETRDLRILLHLTHAVLHTDGLPAFASCVNGFARLVEERWESCHPQLDPDDDNDPTMRVNLIAALSDEESTLKYLRDAELVSARAVGRFSLRDYDVATGEIQPVANPEDGRPPPTMDVVSAAFSETDLDSLQSHAQACRSAMEAANALENSLTRQVGVAQAASLAELRRTLQRMIAIYDQYLLRRGVGSTSETAQSGADGSADGAAGAPQRLTGEISSREDVVRAIDKICEYYARHEPSSPLPLLLRRAKRLTNKSFLEIVRDLSPDALQQVLALGGEDENENNN